MYDWQGAIRQLAAEIERQKKQIRQLEEEKDKIWKEIERIRSRPPLHVEKIDYHFDQLKVERLEGTLNIGINPGQLQDMDEFYPGISPDPLPPEKKEQLGEDLRREMEKMADAEIPKLVEKARSERELPADESFLNFIIQEIKQQIPTRALQSIDRCLAELGNVPEKAVRQWVLNTFRADLNRAVESFIQQFPQKGGNG